MNELNNKIEILKKGFDNLDSTIILIEQTLNEYDTPSKIESRLNDGIKENLDSFLQTLEQLNNNIIFFSKNKNYKGSEILITQLGLMKQRGISLLEKKYQELIEKRSISVPLPSDMQKLKEKNSNYITQLLDEDSLDKLSKIAKKLDSLSAVQYRAVYKEKRSKALEDLLYKVIKRREKTNLLNQIQNDFKQNIENILIIDKEEEKMKKFYKKGTDEYLLIFMYYLEILKGEKRIASKMCFNKVRQ
jgi:hypothetical protein